LAFAVIQLRPAVTDESPDISAAEAGRPAVAGAAEHTEVPKVPADSGIRPDGTERRLSSAFVPFQRAVGWVFSAVVAGATFVAAVGAWLSGSVPGWIIPFLPFVWLALTVAVAWFCYVWPRYEFRWTSYVLDDDGIEIRSGVIWRSITNVPRSRVQHIDVSQGPLERSYGLGRLIIFTAGTNHSRVELPGLDYNDAFALRNHLLPRGADDAV
jgi:membrane protein YdbS with pleckstrin-like domain